MGVRFVLKESILDVLKLESTNEFVVKCDVRPNTIYAMTHNATKRVEIENLNKIIHTLNLIAATKGIDRTFTLEDVMIWEDERGNK
ncbi:MULTISPECIES: hypothetical protein [Bacillaceae]|uniref:hypothetical protein n=1 Tax=Bacillaceae TaxID=186817 RepID=UPI002357ECDC|nr:hypothetical protein [Bacillus weihaiensis]